MTLNEVLEKISSNWNNFTKEEKSIIVKLLAGSEQKE